MPMQKLTFEAPLSVDNGYRNTPIADAASHEFILHDDGNTAQVEWIVHAHDEEYYEVIGLWFDDKTLSDYDGVFELPVQLLDWLTELGYNCEEFYE
jgi:hypothetical protein